MHFGELLAVAIGLAADAFAVSVCKGLAMRRMRWSGALACGLYFGGFQMLMPVLGYFVGVSFYSLIVRYDHWIVFGLLSLIGVNMIRESRQAPEVCEDPGFGFRGMLLLALATSIDALAAGVSFAFAQVSILRASLLIGGTTFVTSFAGVRIGNVFGARSHAWAVLAGGAILVLIGLKILAEHLMGLQ